MYLYLKLDEVKALDVLLNQEILRMVNAEISAINEDNEKKARDVRFVIELLEGIEKYLNIELKTNRDGQK